MKRQKKYFLSGLNDFARRVIKLFTGRKLSAGMMFFVLGISSTVWFLIRVIPKPSRASYPCMRTAAPLMSAFVIYLISLGGISLTVKEIIP